MNAKREPTQTKSIRIREGRIKRGRCFERGWKLWRVLKLFCASAFGVEVESFVLIESSYSADFALQCGKAWNRNFVGRDFCNTFVLIRDGGLCLFVEKSLQRINPSFRSNQLYKTFRLIANYFLSRNKIKFRHSFVSAQVFGLPSSTGPLGFPNKVCDIHLPRIPCKCPRLLQQLFGLDEKRRIAGVRLLFTSWIFNM